MDFNCYKACFYCGRDDHIVYDCVDAPLCYEKYFYLYIDIATRIEQQALPVFPPLGLEEILKNSHPLNCVKNFENLSNEIYEITSWCE